MKRFSSRGYSILAALVFVAVLSSIAVAVNMLGGSGNPIAMTSAAGTVPSITGATQKQLVEPEVDQKCKEAIQRAISGAGKSPQLTQPFKGDTFQQNKCVGAILNEQKAQQIAAQQKISYSQAALKPEAYDCWGEVSKVYMNKKGEGTITSNVQQGLEKGKCQTSFCDESGLNCTNSKLMDGKESVRGWSVNDKDLMKQMTPDQLEGVKNLGELSEQQQKQLQDVFSEQKTATEAEINKNNSRISDINKALENCAYGGCDEAQNQANVKALQAEKAQLEARNTELNQRMEALKRAETSTLTPPGGAPGSQPGGVRLPQSDPRKQQTFQDPSSGGSTGGGGGSALGALGSLLSGLAKGLMGSGAGQGAPCASDPNAYQQQQQQYQMQLQQYNLALQQYQYQQQQAYYYGGVAPTPPTPPTACTPTSSSNTCPTPPAQPTTACSGTWQPVKTQLSNGYSCTSSWQCVPSNATPPTAELSCQPKVADVGMTVALTFACTNATGSTGGGAGFDTNNATSGARNVKIENPPANASGINFGITCRNQNLTANAECAVQIARPTIVLLANPKSVPSGESSRVGWVTSGMSSCVVSSPQMPGFTQQNASNTSVNGVATTSPITRETTVVLTCATLGGNTKAASTTITIGSATSSAPLSVASNIDGETNVKHGDSATISWQTSSAPANSAVALWLVDVASGHSVGLIQRDLLTSGTYSWTLPTSTASVSGCAIDSIAVCSADLIVGRSYSIKASLYSPPDAYLGGYPPANPITPTYHEEDTTPAFKLAN